MRSIRTRPIYDSGFPQIAFGSGEGSYLTTETVAGSAQVGQAVARALRGERSLTILIDGDSNENVAASGELSRGSRNLSLLATQDSGLVRTGLIAAGGTNLVYTLQIPVRSSPANGNNLQNDLTAGEIATLTPKLPASWLQSNACPIFSAPPVSGGTNGIFAGLQAIGEAVDPRLGVAGGTETPWWDRTDNETFCDIYLLRHNGSGYANEIEVRITATDTLLGAVGPSPVVTYTSGSGGIAAANLTSAAAVDAQVVIIRFPVTFKDSGNVLRRCAQLNIRGSGGKAAVIGYDFVRPSKKGLAFSVVSGRSGYKLANYVNDHASAGPVYKTIADWIRQDGGDIAYLPQACVNDAYAVPVSTAAQYKTTVQSRITQIRSDTWLGQNTPVFLVAAPYRDSNTNTVDANDAEYDKYPSVLRDIATTSAFTVSLNLRKYLHKLGFNRGSETSFFSGSAITFPTSARGGSIAAREGVDQWRLNALNPVTPLVAYPYSAGTLVSFPDAGNMLAIQANSGSHPYGGGANYQNWRAARQWLTSIGANGISEPAKTANDSIVNATIAGGQVDPVHFRGRAMFLIRLAETNLIIQSAAMLSIGN